MSGIFGHLNIKDTDRVFAATVGKQVIFEAAQDYIARVNVEIEKQIGLFVESTTTDYTERYKLPGGGYLQRRGSDGRYGAVKALGEWDVGYPLEDFGAQIATNDVDWAYMTMSELSNHLETVGLQNVNTIRWEILHRFLDNVQLSFVDPLHGTVTVEPLANGDAVTYPPVLGSEDEATEDHYLGSGYAPASISDANNPFVTIRDELEHHFGMVTGGSNIMTFINSAQRSVVEDLTDFDPVSDRFVQEGALADEPFNWPQNIPGRILGRVNHCWVVEWAWVPAAYIMAIHGDAPKPLKKRVDPADTGLGEGLQLIAQDEQYPFESSFYRHRFGFGTANRLNGVVMHVDTAGSYTIPSDYD